MEMKTILVIFTFFILCINASAQIPQSFRYQAVARDNSGNLLSNQAVSFRISILSGSVSGAAAYTETHTNLSTNAFGLVELEIGKGNQVTGTFSDINWGSNSYFVQVEIDPAGGTSYQELSTSQLLSVPYALYSQIAGNGFSGDYNDLFNRPLLFDGTWNNLTGIPTEFTPSAHEHSASDITDILPVTNGGTGASTAAAARTNLGATTVGSHLFTLPNPLAVRFIRIDADNRITLRDAVSLRKDIEAGTVNSIATTDGITGGPVTSSGTIGLTGQALALHNLSTNGLIVRTGTATVVSRYLNDGNGIVITNPDGVSGNPTISAKTYNIGDWAFGGIVVWVDATGQHGFVCAKSDQDGGAGVRWNAGTNTWTMAMGDGPLAGKSNTSIIIASQSYGDAMTYAARLCNELQQTQNYKSYGDWYLPSEEELFLMYQNRTAINNTAALYAGSTPLATTLYWSSKEYNNTLARYVNFSNGNVGSASKGQFYRVRAVRSF
jgi:hypothetical protein